MAVQIIADSGATKCEWCAVDNNGEKNTFFTTGISPYFLNTEQITALLQKELLPWLNNAKVAGIHFYGTGLGNPENARIISATLAEIFPAATVAADTDLLGAARALCGSKNGIACILGTGSNSCYYNGEKIVRNRPSLGYVLGDEGSGANLGKKVVQYYLNKTFDTDLSLRFDAMFRTNQMEILENLYKRPFPNRYLASFAVFLSNNRGHEMIEDILENSLNNFIINHLKKYTESLTLPVSFTGSIAYVFKDVLQKLCTNYNLQLSNVFKSPMEGLIKYHSGNL